MRRGAIFRDYYERCGQRPRYATLREIAVIETCGEGEAGLLTYESASGAGIED